MKKLYMIATASALALAPAISFAGEWNGANFGLVVGSGSATLGDVVVDPEGELPGPFTGPGVPDPSTLDATGALYGLSAGYNIDTGNMVFGVEAEYSMSKLSGSKNMFLEPYNNYITISGDSIASIRARIGWKAGADTLIYATGGVEWSTVSVLWESDDVDQTDTFENVYQGMTYGIGVEQMISSSMSIGAEYRMSDYDALTNTTESNSVGNGNFFDVESALSMSSVNLSIRYHF